MRPQLERRVVGSVPNSASVMNLRLMHQKTKITSFLLPLEGNLPHIILVIPGSGTQTYQKASNVSQEAISFPSYPFNDNFMSPYFAETVSKVAQSFSFS